MTMITDRNGDCPVEKHQQIQHYEINDKYSLNILLKIDTTMCISRELFII